jgi:hypothetical protein
MYNSINSIAMVDLALGEACGLADAAVTPLNLQATLWAIDGAALVMATMLLAFKFFRKANDIVVGAFLVFAIGEGIKLSGAAAWLQVFAPAAKA